MRFALLILVLILPLPTAAQGPTIPHGTRVRVETQQKTRAEGTLMSQTSDSIIVATRRATRTAVASAAVTRIAVSSGRSRAHGALWGMKLGAVVLGGGIGLLLGGAYVSSNSEHKSTSGIIPLMVAGAAVGGMYGAVAGTIRGVERWSTVYAAPIRVSFGQFQGSSARGVSVSIRF